MKEEIQKFLEVLEFEKNYSHYTVLNYQKDLEDFCTFVTLKKWTLSELDYNAIREE